MAEIRVSIAKMDCPKNSFRVIVRNWENLLHRCSDLLDMTMKPFYIFTDEGNKVVAFDDLRGGDVLLISDKNVFILPATHSASASTISSDLKALSNELKEIRKQIERIATDISSMNEMNIKKSQRKILHPHRYYVNM